MLSVPPSPALFVPRRLHIRLLLVLVLVLKVCLFLFFARKYDLPVLILLSPLIVDEWALGVVAF
jgi:hypothetical protein